MAKATKMYNRSKDNRVLRRGYVTTKKINKSNSGAMQLGGRRF